MYEGRVRTLYALCCWNAPTSPSLAQWEWEGRGAATMCRGEAGPAGILFRQCALIMLPVRQRLEGMLEYV